jgi:hypothetical protein
MYSDEDKIKFLEEIKEMVRMPNYFVKKGKPNSNLGGYFASKYAKKIPLYQYIKLSTIDKLINLYENETEAGVQIKTEHDPNVKTFFNRLNDMVNKNVLLLDIDKVIKLNKDNVINKTILSSKNILLVNSNKSMLSYSFRDGIKAQEKNGVNHEEHIKGIREMLSRMSKQKTDTIKGTPKRS